MLTLDPVVLVNVAVGATVNTASTYDVGLILTAATEAFTIATRVKSYSADKLDSTGEGGVVADFAATTDTYKAAAKYFGAEPKPQTLKIGVIGSGETVADALSAIRDKDPEWYGVYMVGATSAQIGQIDAYLNSIDSGIQFASYSGTVTAATTAAVEPLTTLATNKTYRTCLLFVNSAGSGTVDEACAVMGCAMGCARENAGLIWQMCYKTIPGMTVNAISQTDVDHLQEQNYNVYVNRAYNHEFFEKGQTAGSTLRVDEVIALDHLRNDLQEALLSLIAGNQTKMPQTNATTTRFIAAATDVLEAYRAIGYIEEGIWYGANVGNVLNGATLPRGYAIWANSFDNQSESDRRARKGMPINVAIHLCGSVESIVLNVTVQE